MRRKRSRPLFRPVFAFSLLAVMCVSVSAQVVEKKKDSVRFIKPVPLEKAGEAKAAPKPALPAAKSVVSGPATPLTDADKLNLGALAHKFTLSSGRKRDGVATSFALPHTTEQAWVSDVAWGNPRSPAASGDVVVVGSGGGNEIYGIEIASGKRLWTARSKDAGISSIEIDGDSAYYTTYSCTFERVRVLTGEMVFAKWISPTVDNQPAVKDGKAFCSFQGAGGTRLTAHDVDSGGEKWSVSTGSMGGIQGPVIGDGYVLLATLDGALGCYDMGSGKLNWKQSLGLTAAPVAVPGGVLCVTPSELAGAAEEIKPAPSPEAKGPQAPAKPESDKDTVVPVKPAKTADEAKAEPQSGTLITHGSRRLGLLATKEIPKQGAITSGPPAGGGLDFQGSRPGFDGEMVFFAVNGYISALALKSNAPQWEVALAGNTARSFTQPVVQNGMVIIGTSDGYVMALSRRTGQALWCYQFEGQSFASKPAVGKDRVLITSTSGSLIAIPTGLSSKQVVGAASPEADVAREFHKNRTPGTPEAPRPDASGPADAARPPERGEARPEPEVDERRVETEPSKGEFERAEKRKQERKAAEGKEYEPKKYRRE